MNTDAWLQLVQQGGMTALIASFLTGLVFSFNPAAWQRCRWRSRM